MFPLMDASLMVRCTSDGDLAEDAVFDLEITNWPGTPLKGLALLVICPSAFSGNTPTLDIVISESSTTNPSSTTQKIATHKQISAAMTPAEFIIPFTNTKEYVSVFFDTGALCSGSTAPSFGTVIAAIVENVGRPWAR